jgi:hypothetical protein
MENKELFCCFRFFAFRSGNISLKDEMNNAQQESSLSSVP